MWIYLLLSTVCCIWNLSHDIFNSTTTWKRLHMNKVADLMLLKWTASTSRNDRPPLIKEDANVYKNVSNVAQNQSLLMTFLYPWIRETSLVLMWLLSVLRWWLHNGIFQKHVRRLNFPRCLGKTHKSDFYPSSTIIFSRKTNKCCLKSFLFQTNNNKKAYSVTDCNDDFVQTCIHFSFHYSVDLFLLIRLEPVCVSLFEREVVTKMNYFNFCYHSPKKTQKQFWLRLKQSDTFLKPCLQVKTLWTARKGFIYWTKLSSVKFSTVLLFCTNHSFSLVLMCMCVQGFTDPKCTVFVCR